MHVLALSPFVQPAPVAAVAAVKGSKGKGTTKGVKGKTSVKGKPTGSTGIEASRAAYVGTGDRIVTIFAYSTPCVSILSELVVGSAVRFHDLQGRNSNAYGALFVKGTTSIVAVDSSTVPAASYTALSFEPWEILCQYDDATVVSLAMYIQSVETKQASNGDPYLELWGADISGVRVGALRMWKFNGVRPALTGFEF